MYYRLIGLLSKLSSVCLHTSGIWEGLPLASGIKTLCFVDHQTIEFWLIQSRQTEKAANSELEEIRNEAYENAKITKSRTKFFHDQCIHRKNFCPWIKSSTLQFMASHLRGEAQDLLVRDLHCAHRLSTWRCGNFWSKEWWGIKSKWTKTKIIPNHWTRVTSWTCHGFFRPILQVTIPTTNQQKKIV